MIVFCFKQKTAYEMRISDWSSDVCSSDLARIDAGMDEQQFAAFRIGGPAEAGEQFVMAGMSADGGAQRVGPAADAGGAVAQHRQIGRASCRERVCPYV